MSRGQEDTANKAEHNEPHLIGKEDLSLGVGHGSKLTGNGT